MRILLLRICLGCSARYWHPPMALGPTPSLIWKSLLCFRSSNNIELMPLITSASKPKYGFSLIEVLVALAVLSLGLLGLAALQTNALRANQEDYYRIQIMNAAEQMADTVRVNWLDSDNDGTPNEYTGLTLTETDSCRTLTGCSSQEMIEDSLWLIQESLTNEIPFLEVHVCQDSTLNDSPVPEPDNASPPAETDFPNDTKAECDASGNQVAIKLWWWDKQLEQWQLYTHALQLW